MSAVRFAFSDLISYFDSSLINHHITQQWVLHHHKPMKTATQIQVNISSVMTE